MEIAGEMASSYHPPKRTVQLKFGAITTVHVAFATGA
jgi:hypothetical protein